MRSALKYIHERIAESEFAEELDEEVRKVKEPKETRRETMILEMEIWKQREDAMAIGMEKGMENGVLKTAFSMIKNGLPLDMVSKCTNLSVETL